MMRLNGRVVAATARKPHARGIHAQTKFVCARKTRARCVRTASTAKRRLDRIIAQRFTNAAQ
eukprot:5897197-Lingulodinium_polyedra.AAC.1